MTKTILKTAPTKVTEIELKHVEGMDFKQLVDEHILSKPQGMIAFDWWLEQCGNTSWWTIKGYSGSQATNDLEFIKITITKR